MEPTIAVFAMMLAVDSPELSGCPVRPEVEPFLRPTDREDIRVEDLLAYRQAHPELFGTTAPPAGPVRLPADFEPRTTLLLAWPEVPDHDQTILDLIAATWQDVEVSVAVEDDQGKRALELALTHAGLPRTAVRMVDVPYDSVWMRDFGPVVVHTADGPVAVDSGYAADCVTDDAIGTRMAQQHQLPVVRPPLVIEGGNLISDGAGTCFTTPVLASDNGRKDWSDGSLATWFGCQQVVVLPELSGGAIPHIDVMLAVADPHTLLLGQSDPATDPKNAELLDRTARTLAKLRALDGEPYRVVRVPMVPVNPSLRDEDGWPLVRSWLNLLILNDKVLVPVFAGADPVVQDRALAQIATEFPGRTLVPIRADSLARRGGTLHCVSQTLPAPPVVAAPVPVAP